MALAVSVSSVPAIGWEGQAVSMYRLDRDLASAPILWLSTVRPDGLPHIVPTWFDWDGEHITVFSRPDAQKVRNIRHARDVMFGVGRTKAGLAVQLLEGVATIVEDALIGPRHLSARFERKYGSRLEEAGFTPDSFAQEYPVAVRIRPTRMLDWGSRETARRRTRPGAARPG